MIGTILTNIYEAVVLLLWISVLMPLSMIAPFLPKKRKSVSGDIVFITGAGSGIGRLMAYGLGKKGAHIICTDIDANTVEETAATIRKCGGMATSYRLDVTDREAVYKLAEQIKRDIGEVTILINNAGIVTGKKFHECPDNLMIKTVDVNAISHFWTLKAFLGPMIEKNAGHIVSIASIAGFGGSPGLVDYCASKFAAVGLMESLSLELLTTANNVKTSVVCPWFIKTGMFEGTVSYSPITLPMLEPDWVADKIIDGILCDEAYIILPKLLWWLVVFKNFLPTTVNVKLSAYLRLHKQMTGFTGREKKVE
jgi:all-trans-retinol dehydrogenase (NAD+)